MNERFDPEDAPCVFLPPPAVIAITYDDEVDVDDAAFRYVLKRPQPDVDSPPRPGRGGGTL